MGAPTRRRIGLSPMRCSSGAQTSIGWSGGFAVSSATACSSLFQRLALLRRGRGRRARARLVHRPADRLQRLPAPLGEDRGKPEFAGHPGRPLRTGPQPPIGRRRTKTRLELVPPLRLQNQRLVPVRQRRSPRASRPSALERASRRSTQRRASDTVAETAAMACPLARSQMAWTGRAAVTSGHERSFSSSADTLRGSATCARARLRDSGRLSLSTAALSGNPTRPLQPETV